MAQNFYRVVVGYNFLLARKGGPPSTMANLIWIGDLEIEFILLSFEFFDIFDSLLVDSADLAELVVDPEVLGDDNRLYLLQRLVGYVCCVLAGVAVVFLEQVVIVYDQLETVFHGLETLVGEGV